MIQAMRRLTQGWPLDGMLIRLIAIERKNIEQKKFLSKFQKKYENSFAKNKFIIFKFPNIQLRKFQKL